ncbi:hypothetical protein D3C76_1397960 [compost metagenome]
MSTWPRVITTARSMMFSSSRMLPYQGKETSIFMASAGIEVMLRRIRLAIFLMKKLTKSGMSSRRSRRDGSSMGKTLSR